MHILYHIIVKEFIQFRRDRRMMVLSFVAPVLQLVILGYAATTDVKNIPMAVCDQDRTASSREYIRRFRDSGYFVLEQEISSPGMLSPLIEEGRVWIGVVIPPSFSADLLARRTASVQIITDGSDANSAGIALNYASQITAQYSRGIIATALERVPAGMKPPSVEAETRVWYNPELKSRNFMVPGVLAMVLMIITMTLTSLGVVREKEVGTLEQLLVTPIRPYHLIIGKLLPFAVIGIIDVFLVLGITRWWFDVPLRGSVPVLLALSGLFLLTTLGLGLFISTISRTQQQAMMTAQFMFFMPFIYLSGFTFPISNMPQAIQVLTYAIPLRYYIVIIRGIFLKGVGMEVLWPQALALVIFGIAILILAVKKFNSKLG